MNANIKEIQTKAELDLETLSSLASGLNINGYNIPQPTTAVLSLLELIESPFIKELTQNEHFNIQHVNEVLFILYHKERAATLLFSNIMDRKYNFTYNNAFQLEVFKFADKLGIYDIAAVTLKIQEMLNVCFNAFEMIPDLNNDNNKLKKKDYMTANG